MYLTLSIGISWSTQMYKKAVDVFEEALKLDPTSDEIKKALRYVSSSSALVRLHLLLLSAISHFNPKWGHHPWVGAWVSNKSQLFVPYVLL